MRADRESPANGRGQAAAGGPRSIVLVSDGEDTARRRSKSETASLPHDRQRGTAHADRPHRAKAHPMQTPAQIGVLAGSHPFAT
jgi:hypothetical protein